MGDCVQHVKDTVGGKSPGGSNHQFPRQISLLAMYGRQSAHTMFLSSAGERQPRKCRGVTSGQEYPPVLQSVVSYDNPAEMSEDCKAFLLAGAANKRPVQFVGSFDKAEFERQFREPFLEYARGSGGRTKVPTADAGPQPLSVVYSEKPGPDAGGFWEAARVWNGNPDDPADNPLLVFMKTNKTPPHHAVVRALQGLANTCGDWDGFGRVVSNVHGTGAARAEGPLHYDDYVNFMVLLMGKKVFIIGQPEIMGAGAGYGRHNEHRDWTPHALTIENRGWFVVTLHPGDGLVLPAGWWHYVITDENSLMANWWTETDLVDVQTDAGAHAGAHADAGRSKSERGGTVRCDSRILQQYVLEGTDFVKVASYQGNSTVVSAPAKKITEKDAFAVVFGWGAMDLLSGYERKEIFIKDATPIPLVDRVWGALMTSKKDGTLKQENVIVKESRSEKEFITECAVYNEFANTAAYCTTMVLGVRVHLSTTSSRTNKKFYVVTLRRNGDVETSSMVREAIVSKFNEESGWMYNDNKPGNFLKTGGPVLMLDFGDCVRSGN